MASLLDHRSPSRLLPASTEVWALPPTPPPESQGLAHTCHLPEVRGTPAAPGRPAWALSLTQGCQSPCVPSFVPGSENSAPPGSRKKGMHATKPHATSSLHTCISAPGQRQASPGPALSSPCPGATSWCGVLLQCPAVTSCCSVLWWDDYTEGAATTSLHDSGSLKCPPTHHLPVH